MTFDPKPITPEGISTALRKADRYRLINDPSSAESICRDVLLLQPRNQEAIQRTVPPGLTVVRNFTLERMSWPASFLAR